MNAKWVLRLMREDDLLACEPGDLFPRLPIRIMDGGYGRTWRAALVTRNLNELWVADITYMRLNEEFVYAAVVLDHIRGA